MSNDEMREMAKSLTEKSAQRKAAAGGGGGGGDVATVPRGQVGRFLDAAAPGGKKKKREREVDGGYEGVERKSRKSKGLLDD